jgi:WD40 repeat protein
LVYFYAVQSLELWDIRENKSTTLNNAHDDLVAALAASSKTGHIASVNLDKTVKLWK